MDSTRSIINLLKEQNDLLKKNFNKTSILLNELQKELSSIKSLLEESKNIIAKWKVFINF